MYHLGAVSSITDQQDSLNDHQGKEYTIQSDEDSCPV